jgi:hypothetical protein
VTSVYPVHRVERQLISYWILGFYLIFFPYFQVFLYLYSVLYVFCRIFMFSINAILVGIKNDEVFKKYITSREKP